MGSSWSSEDINYEGDEERLINRSDWRNCLVAEDNVDREEEEGREDEENEEDEEVDRTARLLKSDFDLDFFFCLFASAALLVATVILFKKRLIDNWISTCAIWSLMRSLLSREFS